MTSKNCWSARVTDLLKGLGDVQRCARCGCKSSSPDIAGGDARAAFKCNRAGRPLDGTSGGRKNPYRSRNGIGVHPEARRAVMTRRAISITIRSLHFIKSMRGSDPDAAVFIWPKCCMPGRISVYRPPHHDLRGGGCRPCRSGMP